MDTRKSAVLAATLLILLLVPRSKVLGVEGVEVEPRLSLPSPPAAEVEFPLEEWGLASRRGQRGIASGTYLEEGGYEAFLWGNPSCAWVSTIFSIHLSEGYDLGSYSIMDGVGSLRLSGRAGDLAVWGKRFAKRRPLGPSQADEQVGRGVGGGAVYERGSALYTFRGSVRAFDYILEDGVSPEDGEGDLIGLSAHFDLFYSDKGVLRFTTRHRRESQYLEEFEGESKVTHQTLVTPFLHVTPGVLVNWDDSRFHPCLRIGYMVSKAINLSFSHQPECWAPSRAQTYLNQDYFQLNPDLEPRGLCRSTKAELELSIDGSNAFRFSLIRKRIEDFVFWETGEVDLLRPANEEVELREVRGKIESGVAFAGNEVSLTGRSAEYPDGCWVPYQPKFELTERLELRPGGGLTLAAGAAYCGGRRYRRTVEEELPGYVTSFVGAEWEMGGSLSIFLRVDNADDTSIEVFKGHYHRGRTWSGGAKLFL